MNERPAGITMIVVLFFVLAGISLIWSLLALSVGGLTSLIGNLFNLDTVGSFGTSTAWSGYFGFISAVVTVVVGFGLLGMKKWAWILALIAVGLSLIQSLVTMFTGGVFAFMCASLGLVIEAIILIYLLRPSIRSTFNA